MAERGPEMFCSAAAGCLDGEGGGGVGWGAEVEG